MPSVEQAEPGDKKDDSSITWGEVTEAGKQLKRNATVGVSEIIFHVISQVGTCGMTAV